ncbi:MAG: rod shape-determining protein [Lachnospiraceae bacterium]|nr:rod shape-determining protein [Lachnospiraceae bacterium]
MARMFGVDLGTDSLKFYERSTNQFHTEKSMIALRGRDEIIAFGDEAWEIYGKAPEDIKVYTPIFRGVISQIEHMEMLFYCVYHKAAKWRVFKGTKFCVAIPMDITEVSKRAILDMIADAGIHAREIFLVDRPLADAVGIGIDILSPGGSLIVNIGAAQTEVTMIASGGIVDSRLLLIGGKQINENIKNAVRKKENLVIGEKTAEQLKIAVGDAAGTAGRSLQIYGRSTITGLPDSKTLDSAFLYEPISEVLYSIAEQIRLILDKIPAEMSEDIVKNGVYITGGSAELLNLGNYFARALNVKVNVANEPTGTVIRGIAAILANVKLRRELMYVPYEKTY